MEYLTGRVEWIPRGLFLKKRHARHVSAETRVESDYRNNGMSCFREELWTRRPPCLSRAAHTEASNGSQHGRIHWRFR